mmetsp:Transcript_67461/g.170168  ORF Transcript_67461/g.170168 Transcript_67461/m.170168 type:complete len:213 (-) Transcript_67461:54-692(-)
MPDLAAQSCGGKVYMVSSLDEDNPAEHAIDGRAGSYWISTGLYPQEIILELGSPGRISSVRLASTCIRRLRIECCQEETPMNFKLIAEGELQDAPQRLQTWEQQCEVQERPTVFIKLSILSGWDDFCSIHTLQVEGQAAAAPAVAAAPAPPLPTRPAEDKPQRTRERLPSQSAELRRGNTGALEVQIPEHGIIKDKNEPDAPKQHDNIATWK